MARTIFSLSALIFSVMLLVMGNTFLSTLLGLRLSLEGIDPAVIGWVLVGFSIGSILGSIYSKNIIERVGHIRSFAVFAATMAVVALLHPLFVSPVVWAILRAISGLSMAGLMVVIESWFSTRANNENRGKLFGIYQIVVYLAAASGQMLIATANPASLRPFSIAAILLTIALIPLALTRMSAPSIERVERLPFKTLFKLSPLALIAAPVSALVSSAFSAMGPVYAHLIGLEISEIAIFMAAPVLAAMFFAWPIGRLSDMFRRQVILLLLAIAAAGCSIVAALYGGSNLLLLFVMVECVIGFTAAIYPIAVALVNDRLHQHQIVAASGGLLLSHGLGSIFGPVLGSSAISLIGPNGLFLFTGSILALLTLFTLWRIIRFPSIPPKEQEPFVTSMPVSDVSILNELDPRNEEFVASPPIHERRRDDRPRPETPEAGSSGRSTRED